MANYYTYGMVPDVDETVFGTSVSYEGLGFPEYAERGSYEEPVATNRGLPEEEPVGPSPLEEYNAPQPMPTRREGLSSRVVPPEGYPVGTVGSTYVPGATLPEGVDPYAPMEFGADNDKLMAGLSLMDPNALKGFAGFSADPNVAATAIKNVDTRAGFGTQGSLYEEGALEAAKSSAATPTENIWKSGFEKLLAEDPNVQAQIDAKIARDLGALQKVESDYSVMKPLSDLLKANKFKEAFDYAKEQGVVDKIMDTNTLRDLRPAFTQDEMKAFFEAIPPDYAGSKYNFDPSRGASKSYDPFGTGTSAELAYPNPNAAFTRKDDKTIENIAKVAALSMLTAGLAPAVMGTAGAGAGASAAGGAGAGAAGAGAAGAAGLTGVVPSGLLAGTTAANLALPVFTVTAGGGLTAAQLAALAAAGGAGAGALAGSGSGASTGSTASTPTPEAPLEEVVVTGSKPPVIPPEVVAPVVGGLPEAFPEVPDVEPPLEEVTVEAKRPVEPEVSVPPIIEPPIVEPPFPEGPLEEVTVEAKRPVEPEIVVPPVVTPPTSPVDTAFPEGPIEEVVVEAERPVETDVVAPPVVVPPSPPVEPPFPEGPIEEVVVETERPPVDDELIIPPVVVPPTTPVDGITEPEINKPNPLKDLLDKYGSLENFLKLLGALGSAGSGTRGGAPTTPSMPSMGGALPKYNYARRQLSPDMDYFTYGTRPEAKFFEDSMQLEKPVQPGLPEPELPPARPPEEERVMATGGLTGYAKGGSNESRYVAGPGSGREDKIPALLSDGEYVIDAETLALLGDGSTKEGARRMDKFRANIRQHKGRALSRGRISPNAKSPDKYMGGGLT